MICFYHGMTSNVTQCHNSVAFPDSCFSWKTSPYIILMQLSIQNHVLCNLVSCLTLSQTTNFRPSQTERGCRRQFQFDENGRKCKLKANSHRFSRSGHKHLYRKFHSKFHCVWSSLSENEYRSGKSYDTRSRRSGIVLTNLG